MDNLDILINYPDYALMQGVQFLYRECSFYARGAVFMQGVQFYARGAVFMQGVQH